MRGKKRGRPKAGPFDDLDILPDEKHFATLLRDLGFASADDRELKLIESYIAFASMVTQSWKGCRYKICRRHQYCRSPAHAAKDPAISPEHRREMESREMPPCLIEPGWLDNLRDRVIAALADFDAAWKAAWAEAGYEVPPEK